MIPNMIFTAFRRPTKWWLGNLSLWIGLGLLDATQSVFIMRSEGMHHAWVALFVTILLSFLPWAPATPVVLMLGQRFPPSGLRPRSKWFVHLAAFAAIALVCTAWVATLQSLLNPWATSPSPELFSRLVVDRFYSTLFQSLFLYAAIVAFGRALDSRDKLVRQEMETARLNEQLSKTQLSALRNQIEPHFLFNALNAVAGLVRQGRSESAVSAIAGLSDCLRRVLDDSHRQRTSLGEEVMFLHKYLDIQKVRFAEALEVSLDVPQELVDAQIPTLLLQGIVENAIKHGIAKRVRGGMIRIGASRNDGKLVLSVYNDGPPIPSDWRNGQPGIGIPNSIARLRGLYGDEFAFDIRSEPPNGVKVSVSLPFTTE